jgi:aminotransferase
VPASSFYSDPSKGKSQVRFCFCKKWETLHAVEKALKRLNDWCGLLGKRKN